MAEPQDVDVLRRRGRRRLVGAIALVLLAVIVLPMVFDRRPNRNATVSVRIPSENEVAVPLKAETGPSSSEAAPAGSQTPTPAQAVKPAAPATPEPAAKAESTGKPDAAKPEPAPQPPPATLAEAKPEKPAVATASSAEAAHAEAALAGKEFIVPVAALAEQERVKALTARLRSAKLPYYTEAINTKSGKVTRVRVGPFVSREEAEQAHAKLVKLGLKPGPVMTKS
jgi:DedD protein